MSQQVVTPDNLGLTIKPNALVANKYDVNIDGFTIQVDVTGKLSANVANITTGLQPIAEKNQPNGYAGLDGSGQIPSVLLPSYVDDVIEVANALALPAIGESGKIYVTTDDNQTYRWSGTQYIAIPEQAVIGAVNGLNVNPSTRNVELGGTLIHNTNIDGAFQLNMQINSITLDLAQSLFVETASGGSIALFADNGDLELQGDNLVRISGDALTIEGALPTTTAVKLVGQDATGKFVELPIPTVTDSTTADNGLTKTLDNIQLGGVLLHDTVIDQAGFNFNSDSLFGTLNTSIQNSNNIAGSGSAGVGFVTKDSASDYSNYLFSGQGVSIVGASDVTGTNPETMNIGGGVQTGNANAFIQTQQVVGVGASVNLNNANASINTQNGTDSSYLSVNPTDISLGVNSATDNSNFGLDALTANLSTTNLAIKGDLQDATYNTGTPATDATTFVVQRADKQFAEIDIATLLGSLADVTTADNGLTKTGNNIQLGGALTQTTTSIFGTGQFDGRDFEIANIQNITLEANVVTINHDANKIVMNDGVFFQTENYIRGTILEAINLDSPVIIFTAQGASLTGEQAGITLSSENGIFLGDVTYDTVPVSSGAFDILVRNQATKLVEKIPSTVLSDLTTASNGLTKTLNDIKLGGNLTQNTTILGGGFDLNIQVDNLTLNGALNTVVDNTDTFRVQMNDSFTVFGQNTGINRFQLTEDGSGSLNANFADGTIATATPTTDITSLLAQNANKDVLEVPFTSVFDEEVTDAFGNHLYWARSIL